MRYGYFVVEGQHDVAAIGRLLSIYGFTVVRMRHDLDDFWGRLIPPSFPHEGNLLARVPVPTFYQREEYSIAIHCANGDFNKISGTLTGTFSNYYNIDDIDSVGLFCDADNTNVDTVFQRLYAQISSYMRFQNLIHAGQISIIESLRSGIYVLPNNQDTGTLESTLLECAKIVYPELLNEATQYVEAIQPLCERRWGRSDKPKVVVGCIANALKPGKANQVSIQDNNWICQDTLLLDIVRPLNTFVAELLDISVL